MILNFISSLTIIFIVINSTKQQELNYNTTVLYKSDISLVCGLNLTSNWTGVKFYKISSSNITTLIGDVTKKYALSLIDNSLQIKSLRRPDIEAKYFCNNTSNNFTINYVFRVSPFFYALEQKKIVLTEGSETSINCKLLYGREGNQTVSFNWLYNGAVLSDIPGKIKISKSIDSLETSINFKQIDLKDKGIYQCQASNDYGNRTESVEIVVKSKLAPLWPFIGVLIEVIAIASLVIFCKYPPPKQSRKSK